MILYLTMFCAVFCYVMLRAIQQRNIAFDNYWWVPPTSFGMAWLDIYCVVTVAHNGLSLALVLTHGCAGTLGALSAMAIHKRFIKVKR